MCWTKWKNIDVESEHNGHPYKGCAIYKVRMRIDNEAVSMPRFFKTDEKGLLYIGKTTNLERRRKDFIRGWGFGKGHSGANLLHWLDNNTNIGRQFRDYECEYSFKHIRRNQLKKLEYQEIEKYVKRYGEVPPLNSNFPGRNNI